MGLNEHNADCCVSRLPALVFMTDGRWGALYPLQMLIRSTKSTRRSSIKRLVTAGLPLPCKPGTKIGEWAGFLCITHDGSRYMSRDGLGSLGYEVRLGHGVRKYDNGRKTCAGGKILDRANKISPHDFQ
jgi:hypothetical protein